MGLGWGVEMAFLRISETSCWLSLCSSSSFSSPQGGVYVCVGGDGGIETIWKIAQAPTLQNQFSSHVLGT